MTSRMAFEINSPLRQVLLSSGLSSGLWYFAPHEPHTQSRGCALLLLCYRVIAQAVFAVQR
jgi:hypothetical protein